MTGSPWATVAFPAFPGGQTLLDSHVQGECGPVQEEGQVWINMEREVEEPSEPGGNQLPVLGQLRRGSSSSRARGRTAGAGGGSSEEVSEEHLEI